VTPKLRVVVVDDEPLAREAVREALARCGDVEVVGEAGNGLDALETITAAAPDLVFLDVSMPGIDGFGIVRALELTPPPLVVFVTAYDEHALRAFDVEALDYVLKPISDDAIGRTVVRARERLAGERSGMGERLQEALSRLRPHGEESFLAGGTGGKWVVVKSTEILYAAAADNYVQLVTERGESLLRGTLKALETRLDPARFVRVHRSFLVDLERVRELRPLPNGDYELALDGGRTVPMSRSYRDAVLARWR
jgi:two-component system LytT family response regulator